MESLCSCSPFVRGFLPGILIGLLSSVLLFNTLWKEPIIVAEKHISQSLLFSSSELISEHKDSLHLSQRELAPLARKLRASKEEDECSPSMYLRTQYLEQSNYLLVVHVHSTPKALDMRNAIRSSWLSKEKMQQKYVARFVIGTKDLSSKDAHRLACENKEHKDLLLLPDVLDTLSISQDWSNSDKLLESFRWTVDNIKFSYIFKCTDSTFAVIDTIVKELEFREEKNEMGDFLWGFFEGGLQAMKGGRLTEKNWFLCSHFLPFPEGGGYIISNSLVTLLLSLEGALQHFEHDDVGLGVWISPFNKIEKHHDVRFNSGCYSRGCQNVYIVTHMETVSSMIKKFTLFEDTGHLCEKEFMSRLSYVYNWTAPANRCCVRTPNIP